MGQKVDSEFAVVLSCIDFRFVHGPNGLSPTREFARGSGLICYSTKRAGGVQDLVRPPQEGYKDSLIRDISVPIKHKGAKAVFLVNHQDCIAYPRFSSLNEEIRIHTDDLRGASQILGNVFPGIEVRMFFAQLEEGESDIFLLKEIYPI